MTAPSPTSTSPNASQGMYVDYNIPLGLYDLVQQVIVNTQNNPNTPQISTTSAPQQWFSQPRSGNDTTTEVIQVNFKQPSQVSELTWDALRCSCTIQPWYQDQQNNWRQVLDDNRLPISLKLSTATSQSWYTANYDLYPIVAKSLQWRISRNYDPLVGTLPYSVGMRNALIRRNIYTRSDGTQGIDEQQDAVGNVIAAYVQDWDASQAIDNNPSTFWRSAPIPDPQGVCSLYLECRDSGGNPQLMDSLYIDPVYSGGQVNLYWSNDDSIPAYLTLSPVSAVPSTDENTNWQQGVGMWDIGSFNDSQPSIYSFPMAWGPLVSQDAWFGIEWTPNFSPVPSNAVQVITINGSPDGGSFTLTFSKAGGMSQTTVGLAHDSTSAQVQEALEALSYIGTGNVLVGGPTGGPYQVTFQGTLGSEAITNLSPTANLTGGNNPGVSVATTTPGGVGGAPPQNCVLLSVTPPGVDGINAVQTIALTGAPTGGTFTLSYGGQTTSPISYSADFSVVGPALQALSSIGTNNVVVSGDIGGPWTVQFVGTLAARPVGVITANPSELTGGEQPGVSISTTTPGATPIAATTGQFVPTLYYDAGGGELVLELFDGTTAYSFNCPINPIFVANQTIRIAVGWQYLTPTVFMQVNDSSGNVLGSLTNTNPGSSLPINISFDGTITFTKFQGTFTAHVIKLENWNSNASVFMANAKVYVNPDPVQPDPSGNIPSTTLDNAIYAAAWTVQEIGTGGSHVSNFEAKSWTPIFSNYVVQKGMLFFPAQIRAKYLQLEFTNLVPESYPVYDSGVQVTYNTFPVSVTAAATGGSGTPTLAQRIGEALTMGADVILRGIGSVNWLNPATVNNAINSTYGVTQGPVSVVLSTLANSAQLANSTALDLINQMTTEVSSPWLYKRTPLNATTLAGQSVNTTAATAPTQGLSTLSNISQAAVASSTTPAITTASNPPTLPVQGADYHVFPGGNMRLPASVMNGLTGASQVVTSQRGNGSTTPLRFNTTGVHNYIQNTVTRDAAVAYFAGIAEVQPYVTTYIDGVDLAQFAFNLYDDSQWVFTNIASYDTGVISTAGFIPSIINGNFDTDINNWVQAQGSWLWDDSVGHWDLGTASVTADGTEKELLSSVVPVSPGATLESSAWVTWTGLTATSGSEAIQLQVQFFNSGTYVSEVTAGLTYTPWPASAPAVGENVWAQIIFSATTDNQITVPDGVNQMRLALVVTTAATAGKINFDTVLIGNTGTVEGSAYKDFQTTSTFVRLVCEFTDSGLVRSDSMWAQSDPNDSNISNTALAYYTSTIPDVIPAGMWGDTVATWGDPVITWGEPVAVVAIQVDPNRIYDNKRVLNFSRASGASAAGIVVRQVVNFVQNGLFRLGCVFYKPTANDNQITISLVRVSDGVVIHEETFNPVVGNWYNYVSAFTEIPAIDDQEYTIQFLCTGDAADQIYLNDLYTEIAGIRYLVQMGGEGGPLYDVTPLRYSGLATVSVTEPVSEFSCQTNIYGPDFYAYGAAFTPNYLK